jgi:hypothetical protein
MFGSPPSLLDEVEEIRARTSANLDRLWGRGQYDPDRDMPLWYRVEKGKQEMMRALIAQAVSAASQSEAPVLDPRFKDPNYHLRKAAQAVVSAFAAKDYVPAKGLRPGMRWHDFRRSENVEDHRAAGPAAPMSMSEGLALREAAMSNRRPPPQGPYSKLQLDAGIADIGRYGPPPVKPLTSEEEKRLKEIQNEVRGRYALQDVHSILRKQLLKFRGY